MSSTAPVRVSQSRTRATQPSRESPTQCTTSATTSRVRSCWLAATAESATDTTVRTTVTTVAGVFNLSRAGSAQIRPGVLMQQTLRPSPGSPASGMTRSQS